MAKVIEIKRIVQIVRIDGSLYAAETASYGINLWGETFEEYCERMEYHECVHPPNFPMPAVQRCQWCASNTNVCDYNGTGEWCPEFCFVGEHNADQGRLRAD